MKTDTLENLTVRLERGGFRFAVSPECPATELLLDVVTGAAAPERYFRQGRRRNVMLAGGLVIKLYDFHRLSDLLHSYRYAPREVECYHDYVKAFGSLEGFRLPRLWGYFQKRLAGPFDRANGIVCEYMTDTRQTNVEDLPRLVPLFAHLYRRGIYHPDMQLKNILYHNGDEQLVVPIDYMGCNVLPTPSWEALLISVAHFLKEGGVSSEAGRPFLTAILASLPEIRLSAAAAWWCVTRLWDYKITTHQYHHPIFLPNELRRKLEEFSASPARL